MEPIYTVSWQRSFTGSPLANLCRVREALASSLNFLVAMVQEQQPSFAPHEPVHMGHLSICLTSKGLLHVTYTEELILQSSGSGIQDRECSGISTTGHTLAGDR